IMECAGIHDILTKSLGSANAINIVHATIAALKQLELPEAVAARRGLPLEHVAPEAMLRHRAEAEAKERSDQQAIAAQSENEAAAAGVGA
ncbi:MAG: 30S ribosomal protein S5, partial [Ancrocorticia sp.]